MKKTTILNLEQVKEIEKTCPTPFHIYDEKAIRKNARALKEAFSWNKNYREYFAVKATPNPFILKILQEEGCGVDCSSFTELILSEALGFSGSDIMFSSNVTPMEEYRKASALGAYINLDDYTHIDYLAEGPGIPETICCRYNPGGVFELGTDIMDNPGESKYGFTKDQMVAGFRRLMELGAKKFGIHSFLASNTVSNDYYPALAGILFELAVELKEKTGAEISFINLSGGVGIPYTPDQEPNDIYKIGEGVRRAYEKVLVPAGMGDAFREFDHQRGVFRLSQRPPGFWIPDGLDGLHQLGQLRSGQFLGHPRSLLSSPAPPGVWPPSRRSGRPSSPGLGPAWRPVPRRTPPGSGQPAPRRFSPR